MSNIIIINKNYNKETVNFVPTNKHPMRILIVYFILVCMLFIGGTSYPSSYSKADLDALSLLFFRPFLLILFMAIVFLFLVVKLYKNKDKSKHY